MAGLAAGAFEQCRELTSVTVDEQSEYLSAAEGLLMNKDGTSLLLYPANRSDSYFVVPDSVTDIGSWAFAGNRNLRALYIGSQVTAMGENVFSGANDGLNVIISGSDAAEACAAAEHVTYMTDSQQFSYETVDNGLKITGYNGTGPIIFIPSNIEGFPVYEVSNITSQSVKTIIVGSGIEIIGADAFLGCPLAERVVLPGSVREIKEGAFANLVYLSDVTLGSVERIGGHAFSGCESLHSLALPDTLTAIGDYAFFQTGLETLYIPAGVTSIGESFVQDCWSLQGIQLDNGNSVLLMEDGLLYNQVTQTLLYAAPGLSGKVSVREGTLRINNWVFDDCNEITEIVLPDSLTEIGEYAFSYCTMLERIGLPDSLKVIGPGAFMRCSLLNNIVLPDALETLGDGAFMHCSSLESLIIPDGITYLSSTFLDCISLHTLVLSENIEWIGGKTFDGCTALQTLNLPAKLANIYDGCKLPPNLKNVTVSPGAIRYRLDDGILYDYETNTIMFVNESVHGAITIRDGVTSIFAGAFQNKKEITSVVLPSGCTDIGERAFAGCGLSEIVIPDSVSFIGYRAFMGSSLASLTINRESIYISSFAFEQCRELTEVHICTDHLVLSEYAFDGCSKLTTVEWPSTVDFYGGECFRNCSSLEAISWPENLTVVGGFEGCSSLRSITLPDSVDTISWNAFNGCSSLTSIVIPAGVTEIGYSAFRGCTGLTSVTLPEGLTTLGEYAFAGTSLTALYIPDGVTEIPDFAFGYLYTLQSVRLPQNLTKIGHFAFAYATSLTNITLPETLIELGDYSFCHNEALLTLTIPGSVKRIGTEAFVDCKALETVNILTGVETVGDSAFWGCTSLTEVTLGNTVAELEDKAFWDCTALRTVNGEGIRFIGEYALANCGELRELTISSALTDIGTYAFKGDKKLVRVSPAADAAGAVLQSVRVIGEGAFYDCLAIPSFDLGNSLETVGDFAFGGTTARSFVFPDSVVSIGIDVFSNNRQITTVRLPANLDMIPQSMFSDASRLESLTIPATVKSIGLQAFYSNWMLGALRLPDGLVSIGSEAFAYSAIILEIPASVVEIADDAFYGAQVEFYTPDGSYACAYAEAHGIPVHKNCTIPSNYFASSAAIAAAVVSETLDDNMTDYQKTEALLDWMLENIAFERYGLLTSSPKPVLLQKRGSNWSWAYAYNALLSAAGIENDLFMPYIIEGESLGDMAQYSVIGGNTPPNMVCIEDEWYFTSLENADREEKIFYFMLDGPSMASRYPKEELMNFTSFEYTYLFQTYGKAIAEELCIDAQAQLDMGTRLFFCPFDPNAIPNGNVIDYIGRYLDAHIRTGANHDEEANILGTYNGFWFSTDLTGVYTEVNLLGCVEYGSVLTQDDVIMEAYLEGIRITGTTQLTSLVPLSDLITEEVQMTDGTFTVKYALAYEGVFTPFLCEYFSTLGPTEFSGTVTCMLKQLTDTFEVEDDTLRISLSDDHAFLWDGKLELKFTPISGNSYAVCQITVDDNPALYENGLRVIELPVEQLSCGSQYQLTVNALGEGCISTAPVFAGTLTGSNHSAMVTSVVLASHQADGMIGSIDCYICGKTLSEPQTIDAAKVLTLPAAMREIAPCAFYGAAMEQVILPSRTTSIGSMAFADCGRLRVVVFNAMNTLIADDAFGELSNIIIVAPSGSDALGFAQAHKMLYYIYETSLN